MFDNRLNSIHEGTHGIQGLDLLGRKVAMHDGAALKALATEIQKTLIKASSIPQLLAYATKLDAVFQKNLNETKEELKKINS